MVSSPTPSSLTLSWSIVFPDVNPINFSLSYTINKLSGVPPAATTGSLLIPYTDAVDAINDKSFSYVLGDLTPYTEYTFSLSSVYVNGTSTSLSASGNTSEDSKLETSMLLECSLSCTVYQRERTNI